MKQKFFEEITSNYFRELLKPLAPKSILVVCGKESFRNCGASDFIKNSLETDFKWTVFNDFDVNPKFEDIIKGRELFIGENCDLIIAIGGGSSIDVAKSINIFQANNEFDLDELVRLNKIRASGVPLIAIPTTAGSGSESTTFAVIYIDGIKYSIDHQSILPRIVVLNPQFLMSQSSYLRAVVGLDALSQSIESYWSVNSTVESKKYAQAAIQLLMDNLVTSIKEPNLKTSGIILNAANLAGKAINISKTTAPHAISYFLTSNYGIPHGHAVFLTLPYVLEFNYFVTEKDLNDKRGIDYVTKTLNELCSFLKVDSIKEAKNTLIDFGKKLGLEMSFNKLGVNLDNILNEINLERVKNNPRRISEILIDFISRN